MGSVNDRSIAELRDVESIERVAWAARRPASSTYELIQRSAERFATRRALSALSSLEPGATAEVLTYAELGRRVTQTANFFTRIGCRGDEPVSILLPCVIGSHLAFWGAETAGIASPINPFLDVAQIASIVASTKSRWLVTAAPGLDRELSAKAAAVAARVPGVVVIEVGPGWHEGAPRLEDAARESSQSLVRGAAPQSHDRAAYFATGGTTGAPKIAIHSHDNEIYCAWALASMFALSPDDVLLCGLPLFHVNALMVTGLAPFLAGAEVVLLDQNGYRTPAVTERFFDLARSVNATIFSAVPTVYGQILDRAGAPQGTRLRFGICGAAPMSVELFKEFEQKTGVRIIEGYGLTEATCATAMNPPGGTPRIGSVGLRLPYQELAIVDAAGRELEANSVGRLLVRGPQVFLGYLTDGQTNPVTADGWLDTGDLARLDSDGFLWLAGRSKDVIIRGGHNIDPLLGEEALASHPAVRQAAVIGRIDERLGEVPVAYVSLKANVTVTESQLLEHCRAHTTERAACPVAVYIVPSLPVTAVGKVFKPALRTMAAELALATKLSSAGLSATVSVVSDQKRGLLAKIGIRDRGDPTREQVIALIGRFPIAIEVTLSD